jgi:hypothetical protein
MPAATRQHLDEKGARSRSGKPGRSLLAGNSGGWTVTNIAAGYSGGNSFGAQLAVAVAERLALNHMQMWRDRPIKGVSHPKEFRRLPPLRNDRGADRGNPDS